FSTQHSALSQSQILTASVSPRLGGRFSPIRANFLTIQKLHRDFFSALRCAARASGRMEGIPFDVYPALALQRALRAYGPCRAILSRPASRDWFLSVQISEFSRGVFWILSLA